MSDAEIGRIEYRIDVTGLESTASKLAQLRDDITGTAKAMKEADKQKIDVTPKGKAKLDEAKTAAEGTAKALTTAGKARLDVAPKGGQKLDEMKTAAEGAAKALATAGKQKVDVTPTGAAQLGTVSEKLRDINTTAAGTTQALSRVGQQKIDVTPTGEGGLKSAAAAADSLAGKARAADTSLGALDVPTQPRVELGAAGEEAGTLASKLGGVKNILAGMGVAIGISGVVTQLKNAVMEASELAESTNAINKIFGDSSGKIFEFSKTAASTIGQADSQARMAAKTFGSFGLIMGKTGDDLAGFAINAASLASDLASFHNTSPQEAVEALGSALRGEMDPIERYGIVLNQSGIEQQALNDGLISNKNEMTSAIKMQATYNAILQQGNYAVGDFAATSGEFSNKLRILQANFTNASAEIGQKFIPIADAAVTLLAGPGIEAMLGAGAAIGPLAEGIGTLAKLFVDLPAPIQQAVMAMIAMRVAQKAWSADLGGVATKGAQAAAGLKAITTANNAVITTANYGTVQMGRFGSAVAEVGKSHPTIARLQASFVNGATGAQRFGTAAGLASASVTGLRMAGTGLVSALGGPWGIAIGAATLALGAWMKRNAEAAEEERQHEAQVAQLSEALKASGGVINDTIREMAATRITDSGIADDLAMIGQSVDGVSQAMLGSDQAFNRYIQSLDDIAQQNVALQYSNGKQVFTETGLAALEAKSDMEQLRGEFMQAQEQAGLMAESQNRVKSEMQATGEAAVSASAEQQELTAAISELGDESSTTADKIKGLNDALTILLGDDLSQEQRLHAWAEAIDGIADVAAEAVGAIDPLTGTFDRNSEAGRRMADEMAGLKDAAVEMAAGAFVTAYEQTGDLDEAIETAAGSMGFARAEFEEMASAAGYSAEEIETLAARYGLLPEDIETAIMMSGEEGAREIISRVQGDLEVLTDEPFTVKLGAADAELINKLRQAGWEVENLPNGEVEITALTDNAKLEFAALGMQIGAIPDKTVNIHTNALKVSEDLYNIGVTTAVLPDGTIEITDNSPTVMEKLKTLRIETEQQRDGTVVITENSDAVAQKIKGALGNGVLNTVSDHTVNIVTKIRQLFENADGGVHFYAGGGVEQHHAQIASGGPIRVWAEPETGGEAYIPLAQSKRQRSMRILGQVADHFGMGLVRAYADGGIDAAGVRAKLSGVGSTYVFGGWSPAGVDCSGAVSLVANLYSGRDMWGGGRFYTGNQGGELEARGFVRGKGGDGTVRVGFKNGGPGGGHTAVTLEDGTNIESGGNTGQGLTIGGKAAGGNDPQFTDFYHLPLADQGGKAVSGSGGFGSSSSSSGGGGSSYSPNHGGGTLFNDGSPLEAAAAIFSMLTGKPVARNVTSWGTALGLDEQGIDPNFKNWNASDIRGSQPTSDAEVKLKKAEADLKTAEERLRIAELRRSELSDTAEESQKASSASAVEQAAQKVDELRASIEGLRAQLQSTGGPVLSPTIKAFASGGFYGLAGKYSAGFDRQATWRLSGEAGPEAYIPLSPGKRAQALDVWAQTGHELGMKRAAINYAMTGSTGETFSLESLGLNMGALSSLISGNILAGLGVTGEGYQGAVFNGPVTIQDPGQFLRQRALDFQRDMQRAASRMFR